MGADDSGRCCPSERACGPDDAAGQRAAHFDARLSALEQRLEHESRSATETEVGLMMATTIVARAVGNVDEVALARIRADLHVAIDSVAAERPSVARPLRYLLYHIDRARFGSPPQPTPPRPPTPGGTPTR